MKRTLLLFAAALLLAACSPPADTTWADFWTRVDKKEFSKITIDDEGTIYADARAGGRFRAKFDRNTISGNEWREFMNRAERVGTAVEFKSSRPMPEPRFSN